MHDPEMIEAVLRYHERTKHYFDRYALGPGELDWANQPNPFRRYEGAPRVRLPLLGPDDAPASPHYNDLYRRGSVPSMPVTIRSLSRLLQYGLGLSAWRQVGATRWALRCNPSSGNLHPTEGYVLIGALPGLGETASLYHYAAREHALERRAACSTLVYDALMFQFPAQAFLVGLSSIHWREAWKYGERAFRYCQHDAGHAIGALRIAAATMGWTAMLLVGPSDEAIEDLFGLNRAEDFVGAEREHPVAVLAVWPTDVAGDGPVRTHHGDPPRLDSVLAHPLTYQYWQGAANRLSRDEPVCWEVIDQVAAATRKTTDEGQGFETPATPRIERNGPASKDGPLAAQFILQRRSLQACDGRTSITTASLYRMLARLMPCVELPVSQRPMPWDAVAWEPTIHLGLFVHRVDDVVPGLYLLARDPTKMGSLKQAMHPRFDWSTPSGCPPDLPLRLLEAGDAKRIATQALLPPGYRRRRRLLARHDRRVPGGAVHARGLVLSTTVLGSWADRAGLVSGSRGRGRAGHGHRLLLRRSGASGVRDRGPCVPVALSLHGRRRGRRPSPDHAGAVRPAWTSKTGSGGA